MPTRIVDLPEELEAFLVKNVESGRYKDASAVIETALKLLDQEEQDYDYKMYALRKAIQEGLDSGLAEGDVFARVREKAGLPRGVNALEST